MISNSVKQWREAKGYSKADLARWVGVHRSFITKLEDGTGQPGGELMIRLAKKLGQPVESLFTLEPDTASFFQSKVMPNSQFSRPPSVASGELTANPTETKKGKTCN
jgi:putative transcriptional regulator